MIWLMPQISSLHLQSKKMNFIIIKKRNLISGWGFSQKEGGERRFLWAVHCDHKRIC